MVNQNSNQVNEINEIVYAEVIEGDYNDVFDKRIVKGTWNQIEQYVRSQFSEEGLERAQDNSTNEGYGLAVYFEDGKDDLFESRIEFFVDANPIEIFDDERVIDLGENA